MSWKLYCIDCAYCEKVPNLFNEKLYKCNYWKKDGIYDLGVCGKFERKGEYE